jgi:hypothetical protein
MKLLFVIFVSALALFATDPQTKKATPKKAKADQTLAAQTLTIPAGAVAGADGDYQFTDADGKKWLYHQTPFGVSRREDTGAAGAASAASATKPVPVSSAGIKATEDGDTVHFEKLGPFGPWKWDKKKSELDAAEKAALQQAQTSSKVISKKD